MQRFYHYWKSRPIKTPTNDISNVKPPCVMRRAALYHIIYIYSIPSLSLASKASKSLPCTNTACSIVSP